MTLLKDQISLIELVDECIRKLENEYRLEDHDENTPMSDSLIDFCNEQIDLIESRQCDASTTFNVSSLEGDEVEKVDDKNEEIIVLEIENENQCSFCFLNFSTEKSLYKHLKRNHLKKGLKKDLNKVLDNLVDFTESNTNDDYGTIMDAESNSDSSRPEALVKVLKCLSTIETIEERKKLKTKSKSNLLPFKGHNTSNDLPESIYKSPYLKMTNKSRSESELKNVDFDDDNDIIFLSDSFDEKKSPIISLSRHGLLPENLDESSLFRNILDNIIDQIVTQDHINLTCESMSLMSTPRKLKTKENLRPKSKELQFEMGKRKRLTQSWENSFVDMSMSKTFVSSNAKRGGEKEQANLACVVNTSPVLLDLKNQIKCCKCGKDFYSQNTLYKHLNEVHLKKARALKKTLNQKEILRENDNFIMVLNAAAFTNPTNKSSQSTDIGECVLENKEANNDLRLPIKFTNDNIETCHKIDERQTKKDEEINKITKSKTSYKSIYDTESSKQTLVSSHSLKKIQKTNKNNMMGAHTQSSTDLFYKNKIEFSDFVQKAKKASQSKSKASVKERQEAKVFLTVKERGQIKRASHLAHLNAEKFNSKFILETFQGEKTLNKKTSSSNKTNLTPVIAPKVLELRKKKKRRP